MDHSIGQLLVMNCTDESFHVSRFLAIVVKEFIQMRRDRVTFGMMIGIPLMQLMLFGLAINSDPKHLPAAVLLADYGPQGRTLLHAIQNSAYFDFVRQVASEQEARRDAGARRGAVRHHHSRKTSHATCPARRQTGHCSSKPTPPIRRPPATPSARCGH